MEMRKRKGGTRKRRRGGRKVHEEMTQGSCQLSPFWWEGENSWERDSRERWLIGSSRFSFPLSLVFSFFLLLLGSSDVVVLPVQLLALAVFFFFFAAFFFLQPFDSNLAPFLIRKEYSRSRGESRAVDVVSWEYWLLDVLLQTENLSGNGRREVIQQLCTRAED